MGDWEDEISLRGMHAADSTIEDFLRDNFMEYTTKVKDHECHLTEAEHPVVNFIYSGPLVELRRWFRMQLLASPNHPNTKAKLKSTARLKADQDYHLNNHYHMIHPFSEARYLWQSFLAIVFVFDFALIPFDISIRTTPKFVWIGGAVCDFCLIIDHATQFFTGYFDEKRQKVVLNPKKIARRYFTTYFLVDLLASLPVNLVLMTFKLNRQPWMYLKIFSACRLARIHTCSTYVEELCRRLGLASSLYLTTIRFALNLFVIGLWAIGVRASIRGGFGQSNYFTQRLKFSVLEVSSKLMLVGLGHQYRGSGLILWMKDIAFLSVGSFLTKYMLLQVLRIYNRINGGQHYYEKTMQEIDQYIAYKNIPSNLRTKIHHYLDFQYQKQFFKEDNIFSIVSSKLVQDILLHKCQTLVENVDLFKDLPTAAVLKIVRKLRSETYLPDDIIVQAGKVGNSMFFISEGMVAVYTKSGAEVTHLYSSDHFGEIALLLRAPRTATVVAVQECELYRLSRRDFHSILVHYPSVLQKLQKEANERLQNILLLSDVPGTNDVKDSLLNDDNIDTYPE